MPYQSPWVTRASRATILSQPIDADPAYVTDADGWDLAEVENAEDVVLVNGRPVPFGPSRDEVGAAVEDILRLRRAARGG